jgi:cytosine/adenosine deaminase-related metal-dependent hydrolase
MTTTLVRGRQVITGIAADGSPQMIENGAILQRDGVIEATGSYDELAARFQVDVVMGSERHVVCPGFINGHHHVGLTPLQLGSPDMPLELWIVRRIAGRMVPPYLDTLYSAFEMVASGVTTVQHLHGRTPKPLSRIVDVAGEVIRAYQDIGMRVSYSYGLRDQNRLVYEEDEAFLKRLPSHLVEPAREMLREQTLDAGESLAVFEDLHARYAGEERVRIQLAPVNLHWCSDRALEQTATVARRFGVPMHMHLLETPLQKEYAQRRIGGSAVAHLHRLGLLGRDMTLGHGVWATESDIDLIAETGTCVCHNCSSNLRLRSGIAPLNAYRRRGVTMALGIDEAGLNDDRDMLLEMRLALRLHREPGLDDRDVPSAADIFRMATSGGAMTTPFGAKIGRLEPGCSADLLLFDWDSVAFPYLSEDVHVLDALVQRARNESLSYVMVGGEVILDHGRFTRVDRAAALAELAAQMKAPATETEQRNRRLGLGLLDHARDVYSDYLRAARGQPFYNLNGRF